MRTNDTREAAADRQIVTTRHIKGPRQLVFQVWTEAHHLASWFGPRGFTTTTQAFEFQEGGIWMFEMQGPDGTPHPNRIEWREIVPPQRIVYLHGASERDPGTFEMTVTFTEREGGTDLTLCAVFSSQAQRDLQIERYHAVEGAQQTLERLDRYVGKLQAANP